MVVTVVAIVVNVVRSPEESLNLSPRVRERTKTLSLPFVVQGLFARALILY